MRNEETLLAARTALAAAMRKAGHPSRSITLSLEVEQDSYCDRVGILVEGQDPARAAAWIESWLRRNGRAVDVPAYALRSGLFVRLSRASIGA